MMRYHEFQTAVVIPLAQSGVTGIISGLLALSLARSAQMDNPVVLGALAATTSQLITWLILLRRWYSTMEYFESLLDTRPGFGENSRETQAAPGYHQPQPRADPRSPNPARTTQGLGRWTGQRPQPERIHLDWQRQTLFHQRVSLVARYVDPTRTGTLEQPWLSKTGLGTDCGWQSRCERNSHAISPLPHCNQCWMNTKSP